MECEKEKELSLILSTFNNADSLDKFLDNLSRCAFPEDWEFILVDNNSTDHTQAIVEAYRARLPINYIFEPKKGKSRGLNAGLEKANGKIFLFTDDDVLPERNWLLATINSMNSNPEVDMFGGRIKVDDSVLPEWIKNSFNLKGILVSEHYYGEDDCFYPPGKIPFGPNIAVRMRAIRVTNPWPENLGPGTSLPVGDEIVFTRNIIFSENKILYSPDIIVTHKPDLNKLTFFRSLYRCYLGGYVAGHYPLKPGDDARKLSNINLMKLRLEKSQSIREVICVTARAAGFFIGKLKNNRSYK